ncbi:hypothetical protein BDV95DRAFT_610691 [Massariosphaeria phaeospora]|uniref:Uncharacterized protein n=1 Tax=Massariosphaeria phaeospora TaxID=100035 RepID=A0A7C8I8F1_9PLEO|nr:hypothetical protein BDV95DRAFT_610691 [Massariosphaeria phaeospora]
MAPRFALPKRFAITASFATKRAPVAFRYNSSSSSSRAARVIEMATQAEKPSPLEATIPIMWLISGALIYTAWNRIDEKSAGNNVEKLLIV